MATESYSSREARFTALFQKVRKRVPAPDLQRWIFLIPNLEDKLFALFLRELCGNSLSGKKLFDLIGSWEKATVLADSSKSDPVLELRRDIGYLRFRGHRKIYHEKYIIGDPERGVDFRESSLYDYCKIVFEYGSQESFYRRDFDVVFADLRQVAGGDRTFAFDLIESVYRNVVPNPTLRPRRLCLEGSTGPLKGFNLLYLGKRELGKRDWRNKIIGMFGDEKPVWEAVENQGARLVAMSEEETRLLQDSPEFVVFEVEDLICNYQKERELGNQPDRFLDGALSLEHFASAYLSKFGR